MFLKHDFFMFWGILGTFYFSFFGLRGGENFRTRREGGAKNFGRVAKNFGPLIFSDFLGVNKYALEK